MFVITHCFLLQPFLELLYSISHKQSTMTITDVHINWPYHMGTTKVLQGNAAVESVTLNVFCKDDGWKTEVLSSIQSLPNLRRLTIHSAMGHPSLWLPVSTLTETLKASSNSLEQLSLHGVGFISDNASTDFIQLTQQCRASQKLSSVSVTDLYFGHHRPRARDGQQQQQMSWMQCSRFCDALAALPAIAQMHLSAIQIRYSRPALTLTALHALLAHPRLRKLSLQHFTIWGGGSALHCALALRCNKTLTHLYLQQIVFASDDSILQGIADNLALQHLVVQHCMLHLHEAEALSKALSQNANLKSLNLCGARLGVDCPTHKANLRSCIAAVAEHVSLQTLDVRCCGNSVKTVEATLQDLLQRNKVLTEVHMNQTNAVVEHHLGLNRAKFWQLQQANVADWMTALNVTKDNQSCLFSMLRENPVLFGEQRTTK